jgi:hypothetical protein
MRRQTEDCDAPARLAISAVESEASAWRSSNMVRSIASNSSGMIYAKRPFALKKCSSQNKPCPHALQNSFTIAMSYS